ncbi:CDGSH iron-sulfur domain-containing protein [Mycolicibacterium sp. CBMA 226]|uniref:CDGSH iron-sulfur domain-containing protein n=1 Tax=Mycolicibacterium sp. CBMA 226 TaxID=2606611 RepID=UPI0012DE2026|nr:CDGSH iron-sulfur domain-containing protein [Mycolicibacterium sp. CBMA 226]MUL75030.1 CDGSH iron-sulfur domain-containing protein [Mycolicibacterium sp. CBMA 226]
MLVQGPVEVELDDGRVFCSDRFVVAICCCQRSKTYPWCDTSHRRQTRSAADDRRRGDNQAHPT